MDNKCLEHSYSNNWFPNKAFTKQIKKGVLIYCCQMDQKPD